LVVSDFSLSPNSLIPQGLAGSQPCVSVFSISGDPHGLEATPVQKKRKEKNPTNKDQMVAGYVPGGDHMPGAGLCFKRPI
jgi:hypothetical protein